MRQLLSILRLLLLLMLLLLILLLLMLLLRRIRLLLRFFWLCHVLMLLLVARRAATGARGWLLRRTRRGTASPASRHGCTMLLTWKTAAGDEEFDDERDETRSKS